MKSMVKSWQKALSIFFSVLIIFTALPIYASDEDILQNEVSTVITEEMSDSLVSEENQSFAENNEEEAFEEAKNNSLENSEETQISESSKNAFASTDISELTNMVAFRNLSLLGGATARNLSHGDLRPIVDLTTMLPDRTFTNETRYEVDKQIVAVADISVTGTNGLITEPWVVLKVPKVAGEKITRPAFMISELARQSLFLEKEDAYYMVYKFDNLSGGTKMTFPYPFSFIRDNTNDQDTLSPTIKMIDASTVVNKNTRNAEELINYAQTLPMLSEDTITYTAIKNEYLYTNSGIGYSGSDKTEKINQSSADTLNNTIYVYDQGVEAGAVDSGSNVRRKSA